MSPLVPVDDACMAFPRLTRRTGCRAGLVIWLATTSPSRDSVVRMMPSRQPTAISAARPSAALPAGLGGD